LAQAFWLKPSAQAGVTQGPIHILLCSANIRSCGVAASRLAMRKVIAVAFVYLIVSGHGRRMRALDSPRQNDSFAEDQNDWNAGMRSSNHAKHLGGELKTMLADPALQRHMHRVAKEMESAKTDPKVQEAAQEHAKRIVLEMESVMTSTSGHPYMNRLTELIDAIRADPIVQEHAKRSTEQLMETMVDPNVQEQEFLKCVSEQLEVTMSDPNVRKHAKRIEEHLMMMMTPDIHVQDHGGTSIGQLMEMFMTEPVVQKRLKSVATKMNAMEKDPRIQGLMKHLKREATQMSARITATPSSQPMSSSAIQLEAAFHPLAPVRFSVRRPTNFTAASSVHADLPHRTQAVQPQVVMQAEPKPSETSAEATDGSSGTHTPRKAELNLKRIARLLTVPLAWSTYSPVVKAAYAVPHAPNPLVLLTFFQFVSYSALLLLGVVTARMRAGASSDNPSLRAGAEIGLWLFLGKVLQMLGLQRTEAARAGFFIELSVLLVPLTEALLLGRRLSPRVWTACGFSAIGFATIFGGGLLAGGGAGDVVMKGRLLGDVMVAAAAAMYTTQILRMGKHSRTRRGRILPLARAAAGAELIYSLVTTLALASFGALGSSFGNWAGALTPPEVQTLLVVVLWIGLIPCTFGGVWAQGSSQASIPPSVAQVFYSLQPIFGAGLSALILHEKIETEEFVGGGLILLAAVLAATDRPSEALVTPRRRWWWPPSWWGRRLTA